MKIRTEGAYRIKAAEGNGRVEWRKREALIEEYARINEAYGKTAWWRWIRRRRLLQEGRRIAVRF